MFPCSFISIMFELRAVLFGCFSHPKDRVLFGYNFSIEGIFVSIDSDSDREFFSIYFAWNQVVMSLGLSGLFVTSFWEVYTSFAHGV